MCPACYRKAWFSSLLTLICYSVQRACQGVSEAAAIMSESEWIQCIENDQVHWSACTFDTNVSNIFIIRHLLNKSWNRFISFHSRSTHSLYFSTSSFSSFVPLTHKQLCKVCSLSSHLMVLNTQHKYLHIQTFSELVPTTHFLFFALRHINTSTWGFCNLHAPKWEKHTSKKEEGWIRLLGITVAWKAQR